MTSTLGYCHSVITPHIQSVSESYQNKYRIWPLLPSPPGSDHHHLLPGLVQTASSLIFVLLALPAPLQQHNQSYHVTMRDRPGHSLAPFKVCLKAQILPGVPLLPFLLFSPSSAAATLASLLLLKHTKQVPASGPLHVPFPLVGKPFPQTPKRPCSLQKLRGLY